MMWLGLALRVWAIAALGGDFRTTVEVEPGQPVVSSGPYGSIRHPSYAGLLLIVAGFGAALGNWLSLAACVVLPLPAIVWRIHVEEAELNRVLGADIPRVPIRPRALDPTGLVSTTTDLRWNEDAPSHAGHSTRRGSGGDQPGAPGKPEARSF